MSITYVDATIEGNDFDISTPLVIPEPTGIQNDDFLLCFFGSNMHSGTMSPPAGWTEIEHIDEGSQLTGVWYKVAFGESGSYSWTTTSGTTFHAVGEIIVFRGVDPTAPFDVTYSEPSHHGSENSATPTPPTITTNTDGAFVATSYFAESSGTPPTLTGPSGYTSPVQSINGAFKTHGSVAYKEIATAGLESPPDWGSVVSINAHMYTIALFPDDGSIKISDTFYDPATGWDWVAHDGLTIPPDSVLYKDDGTHDGGDGEAVLADSTKSWAVDKWIGMKVGNIPDGSETIGTDSDATTVTGVLSGGDEDDWDDDDNYTIVTNIDTSDQIVYELATDNSGTVEMTAKAQPSITGPSGTHEFDYLIRDVTDSKKSTTQTATVEVT